ncbi:MAG: hypothetical protein GY807_10530, partial [Gammaproteobacteria bacterium]|nr:hypothetical protein [Gammaproteobacteria bacterium]
DGGSGDGGSGDGGSGDVGSGQHNPPTVIDQSFFAQQGKTLSVNAPGILESSSDPDNDILIAILVTEPSHGTLNLHTNGSFEYTHNGDSSKTDSFTFMANDGIDNSGTASATISINGVPVTTNACLPIKDLPIDLNNFVSDDDVLLGFSIENQANKGTALLQPDGTLNYSPNTGATGFDSFTYQVDDNNGGIATGTVNIAIGKTRIMPLGDSITAGVIPKGTSCPLNPDDSDFIPKSQQIGYREKLFTKLDQENYIVDFVGSFAFGSSATPPIEDPDHEGIGGNTAAQVRNRVNAALIANPADIVLLHVGTNDINSDVPSQTIIDIGEILDAIDDWAASNNEVTVLLSTIIDRSENAICATRDFGNPKVNTLNGMINGLNSSRPNIDLVLVDQHGAINNPATQISVDGVHPNKTGYGRMADEWFEKLTDASNNIQILRCPAN